ncbi:glycoside hydrolase family 88 protein [Siansivirga zeaxanthinifaciens]|uniref:Uncharacterized protein n=1 Tax=Siansivirga zeaxanthinifaciens CC-SAMT-1 TaxID=1454006 RepID=A0A0C5WDZ4_9FLAO|nr:hypothetical protein [Siansivirga zeaxanthinifaciens]AJR04482.1 hypothetical protein AW14_13275 [Siansivirga zeaxanthinifaciens CC-SAMT-1]
MKRRSFMHLTALGSASLLLPVYACGGSQKQRELILSSDFDALSFKLLTTWCDAMVRDQINDLNNPVTHGALYCHACEDIHGRCSDAVYPLMYMADKTGNQKYLEAAIKLMDWSVNVDLPDGSWTNMLDPKSWNGTTVFGSIALGEALHHHGHLFTNEMKQKWEARLKRAIEYVYLKYDDHFSHINYRFTAIYALSFLGDYFNEEKYIKRSDELALLIPKYLTEPNKLLYGEDHPDDEKSEKGLLPIDIGYNVEESLNAVVQYAVHKKDEKLIQLLTESLNGHLEFMLPDGAWDNSFGTRQNKWTYWGSRTTDGCQPAFTLLADRNPAFGTAAILSTELLQRCTVNGLLAGGLHYESYGEKPCMHHTFAHAKNVAFVLDNSKKLKNVNKKTPIPRKANDGVKHFPELDVWLGARGPWRSTVSSYDQVWKKKYSVAATGGSLAVLWHEKVGPLFTASMVEYMEVEPYNQQPQPGEEFCLTPRVERIVNNVWYTNIQDLKAKVSVTDSNGKINFSVNTILTDRDKATLNLDGAFTLNYAFNKEKTTIKALRTASDANGDTLVLPIISPTGEKVVKVSDTKIEIHKKEGIVVLESNVPLAIKKSEKERIFNQVPGMEVVPIMVAFPEGIKEVVCSIQVI